MTHDERAPQPGVEPLWDAAKVSEYIGVPVGTLQQWRHRKVGPPAFRLGGGRVRYRPSAVERWISEQEQAESQA